MTNDQLLFKDIDYEGIKDGIVEYLKNTDSFQNANYEGTFLSHLTNMFSYTGAIFGNYVTMMANEQFINTCNKYESGNMLGNLVGYKTHGFAASKVNVTLTPNLESMGIEEGEEVNYIGWSADIPKNALFSTIGDNGQGNKLSFSNLIESNLTIKSADDDTLNAVTLELIQGIPLSLEFVSDGSALQSFEIPNPFIDWKEIKVSVVDENDDEEWTSVITWFTNSEDDKVYVPFINPKGLLEIMFADGNFGKIPEAGKTIRVDYYITQGAGGNISEDYIGSLVDTVKFVNPNDSLQSIDGSFDVSQPNASTSGQNIESLSRIKKFAPLYYGIQNRLVNNDDYKNYVLGEYSYLVDANAFNYTEAIDVGLLKSPCETEFINEKFTLYDLTELNGRDELYKIPTDWTMNGFYEYYTIEYNPKDEVDDEISTMYEPYFKASELLNFGTYSGLFVDTTKPCQESVGSTMSQAVSFSTDAECAKIVKFEVEVLNLEKNLDGSFADVDNNQIDLYIDGERLFTRIEDFTYDSNGYDSETCCTDRKGDKSGWKTIYGVFLVDKTKINTVDNIVSMMGSILIGADSTLLLRNPKIYLDTCLNNSDIFVVPVPENGGYLSIENKDDILDALDMIDMMNVRNHIIAPIYQTFDVKVIFKKDENVNRTTQEITNDINSTVTTMFLPKNRVLGDLLSTVDIMEAINDIIGVDRVKVSLNPRSADMANRANEFGDYQLTQAEFPILGKILIG